MENRITIYIPVTFTKALDLNPDVVVTKTLLELIYDSTYILIQAVKRNIQCQQESLYKNKNRVFEVSGTEIKYLSKDHKIKCYSLEEIADLEHIIEYLYEPTENNQASLMNRNNYALLLHSLAFINQDCDFPWDLYHALIASLS